MKIYDCFTFFNELELLELRLNELNNVVDYFVLVEATKTHSFIDKPLYYNDNKERFSEFSEKIIHIIVDDLPSNVHTWSNENFQRNCIMRGLIDCNDNDIVMISDLDEIPRASELEKIKNNFSENNIYNFSHKLYYYYLNVFDMDFWKGTKLCSYTKLKEITPQNLRIQHYINTIIVSNGGWHFSYLGGLDRIKYKIESFAHFEVNNDKVKDNIENNVLNLKSLYDKDYNFKLVDIDDTYPKYILDNKEKFNHLIKTK